jgi:hypothetical protein
LSDTSEQAIVPEIISQNQEPSEPKIEVSLRRHGLRYVRAFAIGFIVLQIAGLCIPGDYSDEPFIMFALNNALDLSLVYLTIVVPIGIIVYLLGRVILLLSQRRSLPADNRLLFDFVISSSLVITVIANLGIFLTWTNAFLPSPIYDIPILSVLEGGIVVASMFFLALGVFYRFLSRLYLTLLDKHGLGFAYLRESGRMVDRAIGPMLGFMTAAVPGTLAYLWPLSIPLAVLLLTQSEKIQSEAELAPLAIEMFPSGMIREPVPKMSASQPQEKLIYEQFRFSMKKLTRWMILSIGIVMMIYFVTTSDALAILAYVLGIPSGFYVSIVNPFYYWSSALGAAICSAGLFILLCLFNNLRRIERPEGHVLSPRHRFEWLIDFGISVIAIALLMIYSLPQIGIETWTSMSTELFWNYFYDYTPGYMPWASLVVATAFQVSILLILVGLALRVAGNAVGFLGKEETTALKWQLRSGKVLIVGVSLAIGNQIVLTGGFYFGIISEGLVMIGLTLLLVTMIFSYARMQEIRWLDAGGEGS